MSTEADQAISLPSEPAQTIDDVLGVMTRIEGALDPRDGLAAFNRLYLAVTVAVQEAVQGTTFQFPGWVGRLDVIFANLESAEDRVKEVFATGMVGLVDQAAGRADDEMAMWSVRAARDAAWTHAELIWHLQSVPALQEDFVATLDRFTGFAGRGLLKPSRAIGGLL